MEKFGCPVIGRFPESRLDCCMPYLSPPLANDGQLKVLSVDLLKSKTGQNRLEHHTDRYQSDNLIIRRGQSFQMWIELSQAFNPRSHTLHLQLSLGPRPILSKGTLVIVPLVDKLDNKEWQAKIIEENKTSIKLSISVPPTAPIGRYELSVIASTERGSHCYGRKPENDIYLLFNPWCKDDSVFMDNEDERKEYVLNDVGILYNGTESQIGGRTWMFGQFADGILEACLFILEGSKALASGWGDPVNTVRVVSAMVNYEDDDGVLQGNWSNNYVNGTPPTLWNGSVDILRKYYNSGGRTVKFGQCWVFSGVTTTILRCLGIPTRSVTNFSSAHDTDVSLTTDLYFDEKMQPIPHLNSDSIWNYHVWNECWMARPDLPTGMGGWQALDATPQETSQGIFRCGPTPVAAVRDGLIYLKYDAPFVFAEVNSDKIYWQRQANGSFTQIFCEKSVVGHCISTKAVGSDCREDITHLYKHPEGSEAERISVETASRYGSKPNNYSCAVTNDVTLQVTVKEQGPFVGEDAQLFFSVKNSSSEKRSVTLYCQVAVMYYTGVQKGTVKKDEIPVKLKAKEAQALAWTVPYDQYKDQLVDQAAMMLTVLGRVRETQQVLATALNFRLNMPVISITPVGNAVVGKEMSAKIGFNNPLPRALKSMKFRISGLGLLNTKDIQYGDIESLESISMTVKFTPKLAGQRKLLISLDCQQLTLVYGAADILVKEK